MEDRRSGGVSRTASTSGASSAHRVGTARPESLRVPDGCGFALTTTGRDDAGRALWQGGPRSRQPHRDPKTAPLTRAWGERSPRRVRAVSGQPRILVSVSEPLAHPDWKQHGATLSGKPQKTGANGGLQRRFETANPPSGMALARRKLSLCVSAGRPLGCDDVVDFDERTLQAVGSDVVVRPALGDPPATARARRILTDSLRVPALRFRTCSARPTCFSITPRRSYAPNASSLRNRRRFAGAHARYALLPALAAGAAAGPETPGCSRRGATCVH